MSFKMHLKITLIALFYVFTNNFLYGQIYNLQKSLQTSKANNLFLKAEKINFEMAMADITTSKLRPNPTLNMQFLQLMNSQYFADNTNFYQNKNRQVWWQFTKIFQLPNQRKYKIEYAEKNNILVKKNYAETERNLFFEVANKWLEAWNLEKQLEIINIAKSNIDTLLKINERRLKNQVITETEVLRTQLLVLQYEMKQKSIKQNIDNKIRELKLSIGTQDSLQIDKNDNFEVVNNAKLDSLLNFAIENRSDIIALKANLQATETNIKLQNANAIPKPELGFLWNPQNSVPYFGIFATIQLPIFDRNQGNINRSKVEKLQVEQVLIATQNKIKIEITNALYAFDFQKNNLEKFKKLLETSQIILDNVRYAYLRGGTTIIDFLEAQRSWLETQQQYYEILQQVKQTYLQLIFATGQINLLGE
ncbi:MAG: TolC family protein [Bacteroidetes bacterium]|nr:MAG: TolC family protein [Bacteroidota bacterium]TAG88673.1 MAG: TolC family protein [Bacteroidota bacterium]